MAAKTIREMASTRAPKFGHFLVEFSTPGIGHICKAAGCDFICLDMEHSGFGYDKLKDMLRFMEAADMPTMVRVPTRDYTWIARACDLGAEGLVLPMVADADEARRIVSYMKYPPVGIRGVAPGVAHQRYRQGNVVEGLKQANVKTTFFCQIETATGLSNVEEIAAVPGVDCLWIGHFDLSASMGIPGEFDNPRYTQAVSRIIDAAQANKLSLGHLVPTVAEGVRLNKLGFDFICYNGDVWLFQAALAAGIDELRAKCGG
jgi:2-keto-3-deoxy-L-rhamnonate aldolase RhmA